MKNWQSKRFLLAGYGFPAEYGLYHLFAAGVQPGQIMAITDPVDSRNGGFTQALELRQVPTSVQSPKSAELQAGVAAFAPDIIISLHYRQKIPAAILSSAKIGAINLHPSLLPKYRGTNSVPWAIIHGEQETGFSFHYMEEDFDTGNILLQQRLSIAADDTAFALFHRQITAALPRLPEVLDMVIDRASGVPQNGASSYFPRAVPHGGVIDPAWDEAKIERFIRAMVFPPFAPAQLVIEGQSYPVASMAAYHQLREKAR